MHQSLLRKSPEDNGFFSDDQRSSIVVAIITFSYPSSRKIRKLSLLVSHYVQTIPPARRYYVY